MPKRYFLGWDTPFLWSLTEWLTNGGFREESACKKDESPFDLRGLIVVIPSQRGARRLLELLSFKAHEARDVLLPPVISAPSELSKLIDPSLEQELVTHERMLVWNELARTNSQLIENIFQSKGMVTESTNQGNAYSKPGAHYQLLTFLDSLRQELLDNLMRPADIILNHNSHLSPEMLDRWSSLQKLFDLYDNFTFENNLIDRHRAYDQASLQNGLDSQKLILAACTNLSKHERNVCQSSGLDISIGIFAPPEHKDGFDDIGCLIPDYWNKKRVAPQRSQLYFSDTPLQIPAKLAEFSKNALSLGIPLSHITLGVLSPELTSPIQYELEKQSLTGVAPGTQTLRDTALGKLLLAVSKIWSNGDEALSEILKNPLFILLLASEKLTEEVDTSPPFVSLSPAIIAEDIDCLWLESLSHSPGRATALPTIRQDRLLRIDDILTKLQIIKKLDLNTIQEFSANLLYILNGVRSVLYGDDTTEDIASLKSLTRGMEEIEAILGKYCATPATLTHLLAANDFLLLIKDEFFRSEVAPLELEGIEVLGWYELLLDDSICCAISNFNEDTIPTKRTPDPFLPNSLRRLLELDDNHKRFANDAYHLSAILNSKRSVALFACRRGQTGDQLKLSRLALGIDPIEFIPVLKSFYSETPREISSELELHGLANKEKSQQPSLQNNWHPLTPRSEPYNTFPLDRLSVSAIKTYIRCPYEFYLRYILGTENPDFQAREISSAVLGSLLHSVFNKVSLLQDIQSLSSESIISHAKRLFEKESASRFGSNPSLMIALQIENTIKKIRAFSNWEAGIRSKGWITLKSEFALPDNKSCILSSQERIMISGIVDRIDYLPVEQRFRIIDFKTSDKPYLFKSCLKKGRWIDPQLPLYAGILEKHLHGLLPKEFENVDGKPKIEIALVSLDRSGKVNFEIKDVDQKDVEDAFGVATEVAELILNSQFSITDGLSLPVYERLFGTSGEGFSFLESTDEDLGEIS